MSDKARAVEPGEGMTREQLVRAHFNAYGDLTWKEHLEPKFEQAGLDADSMRRYRQEWDAYTEKRDWAWWQNNVANDSNDKLQGEIARCHEEIEAIDRRRASRARDHGSSAFQDILSGDNLDRGRSPEVAPARTKTQVM